MSYEVKLEQYHGPFDLLLQLIEQEELDITEISLSQVTEQYIKYLEKIETLYPEELADFLVVATKLLLIKSRTMLPYLQVEDEEDAANLEDQLKIYREFHDASKVIEDMIKQKKFTYGRVDSWYANPEVIFTPPKNVDKNKLSKFFSDVLDSLEPVIKLPKSAIEKAVSLKEKICHLQEHLNEQAQMSFKKVVSTSENKTEVIITFLALLELVKQEMVCVRQDKNFEDITIEKL